jgi:hypothetical protein
MRLLMLLFVGEWASSKHKTGGLDWKIDTADQEITTSKFKPLGLKKKALFGLVTSQPNPLAVAAHSPFL